MSVDTDMTGVPIAFTGGRLIDGRGGNVIENAVVLVENSQIRAVGPAERRLSPASAEQIDYDKLLDDLTEATIITEREKIESVLKEWEDQQVIKSLASIEITDEYIKNMYLKFLKTIVNPPQPDYYKEYGIENAEESLAKVEALGRQMHNLFLAMSDECFSKYGRLVTIMRDGLYIDWDNIPYAIKHNNARDIYWYEMHNICVEAADEEYIKLFYPGKGHFHSSLVLDLDGDSQEDNVKFFYKDKNDVDGIFSLLVESNGKCFESDDVTIASKGFCGIEEIAISEKINPFIGVYYPAGAHGVVQKLYSFDGNSLRKVAEIFSDGPSISFEDVDEDGVKEIVAKQRDYEINPIEESFIETYSFKDGKWQRISVYRTATKEYLSLDWNKDETDIKAYIKNAESFVNPKSDLNRK